MLQGKDLAKHRFLRQANLRHLRAVRRRAQNCQKRDKENLHQIVLGVLRPRIGNKPKVFVESIHRRLLANQETLSESTLSPLATPPSLPRNRYSPYAIPLPQGGGRFEDCFRD